MAWVIAWLVLTVVLVACYLAWWEDKLDRWWLGFLSRTRANRVIRQEQRRSRRLDG